MSQPTAMADATAPGASPLVRRAPLALFLLAPAAVLVPLAVAPFLAWLAIGAACALAWRDAPRAAAAGLGALGILVAIVFAGFGVSLWNASVYEAQPWLEETAAAAILATLCAPAGIFLVAEARQSRLARILAGAGVAIVGAWTLAFPTVFARSGAGEGHIVIFALGAILVLAALVLALAARGQPN